MKLSLDVARVVGVLFAFGCLGVVSGCSDAASGSSSLMEDGAECTPDPEPIDPECNVCVAPGTPPEFDGVLVVQGDAPLPVATGGELTGAWIVAGVTLYLPPVVTSLADLDQSGFDGSGWFVLEPPGTFRFAVDGTARIELTSSDEPMELGAGSGAKGTYTIRGNAIDFSPECQFTDSPMGQEAMEDGTATFRLEGNPFSVGPGGEDAQIQLQLSVQGFPVDIVADLERAY
ncbi:MAG: hypothetical protein HYY06_28195 [Deltaproteobacteria bacterium]|nr:hypothetical protein [Deltaproteobacteria bacterium]